MKYRIVCWPGSGVTPKALDEKTIRESFIARTSYVEADSRQMAARIHLTNGCTSDGCEVHET